MMRLLSQGDTIPEKERSTILEEMADYLGLDHEEVKLANGRLPFWHYAKMLLKKEQMVIGFYDSSVKALNPFPDREGLPYPDPSLAGPERLFASGINAHIRHYLKLDTEREYHLLSHEVNHAWKMEETHAFNRQVGATDELRFGMALNPHMKIIIVHGNHDMVTPYFASKRLVSQMRLTPEQKKKISLKNFNGGHMFYTWEKSRQDFCTTIKKFVEE
ncbi:MAG TPA: hypothetical protein VI754_12850 [Bacteriovoracaceae bacterium]|nr:hypothetical protein [Bacteriovoracaceae bacterium]